MPMETIVVLAVIALIAVAAIFFFHQKRKREQLKERFGPEYQEAVHRYGSESKAESALAERAKRISSYRIRPLSAEEQRQFSDEWVAAQSRFVDNPAHAVNVADELVCRVMETRGYPMSDFERRAEDISVDHPHIVRNYRTSHNIAVAANEGRATTEDLRRAMVAYRDLFAELLESRQPEEVRR